MPHLLELRCWRGLGWRGRLKGKRRLWLRIQYVAGDHVNAEGRKVEGVVFERGYKTSREAERMACKLRARYAAVLIDEDRAW